MRRGTGRVLASAAAQFQAADCAAEALVAPPTQQPRRVGRALPSARGGPWTWQRTLSSASAMSSPIWSSLPDEIDATARISFRDETGCARFLSSCSRNATVLSMPFFSGTGFRPDETACMPYVIISRARMDAVVVPSPAESLVRPATCVRRRVRPLGRCE